MADYDMSIHTNPDAQAWAKFFMECNPGSSVPEDVMVTWFANAMMAMHDYMLHDHMCPVLLPEFRTALEEINADIKPELCASELDLIVWWGRQVDRLQAIAASALEKGQ